ncbi:hypothetical protein ACWGPT_07455 [Pseudorhizobium sp. NPDC055634]
MVIMARVLAELGERGKQVSDTTPRRAPEHCLLQTWQNAKMWLMAFLLMAANKISGIKGMETREAVAPRDRCGC